MTEHSYAVFALLEENQSYVHPDQLLDNLM